MNRTSLNVIPYCLMCLSLSVEAGCYTERTAGPGPHLDYVLPPSPYSLPVPATNEESSPFQTTGFSVPAGTEVIVTVVGELNYTSNFNRLACSPTPPVVLPGGLSIVGPDGFPDIGGHRVHVILHGPDDNEVDLTPHTPSSSAVAGRIRAVNNGVLWFFRPFGFSGSCWSEATGYQPDYFVSGSQTMTVKVVAPDDNCPPNGDAPLDPSGSAPLDTREVTDTLLKALTLSNPNATPGTGVKKEVGGIIWQRVGGDGTFFAQIVTDPLLVTATECSWIISGQPPAPEPMAHPVAIFHTHPSSTGEDIYECVAQPNQQPLAQYLGDAKPVPKATPDLNGGGSPDDWNAANTWPQYIINKDGRIYRLDAGTPLNQQKNNLNRWEWKKPKVAGCVTK